MQKTFFFLIYRTTKTQDLYKQHHLIRNENNVPQKPNKKKTPEILFEKLKVIPIMMIPTYYPAPKILYI